MTPERIAELRPYVNVEALDEIERLQTLAAEILDDLQTTVPQIGSLAEKWGLPEQLKDYEKRLAQ